MIGRNIVQGPEYETDTSLKESSLGQFLFKSCEKLFGDKLCQIDGTHDNSETYSSVKQRCTRLAIELQKRKINSEDVIATCSNNTIDNTIPIISSLFIGAKIANFDPTLSVRNTRYLLASVAPKIIFVEESSLNLIEQSLEETGLKSEIVVLGKSSKYVQFSDLLKPQENENQFTPVQVNVHETAILFFSSGTTGLPKAICHSHFSFLQLTEMASKNGLEANCILHFTSFYWISGMLMLTCTFLEGGTRVFAEETDGEGIFKMIEKYKLRAVFMAPIYTYKLTNVENPKKYNLSSLKVLLTGGTSISTEQYKRLEKLFERADVLFGYGLTEIGLLTGFNPAKDRSLMKSKLGSCGTPVPGVTLKVVDPDNEGALGSYQKGEIRAKSNGIMKGYYNLDSSSCFDRDGFLKTGDIGYYDNDGCFYVIERIKEMFKYRSWHIVPSVIEAVLLEHPAVRETVVFGLPRGEEEGEIPAACVVLKENFNVDKEEIEKFVEERVSDKEKLRGGITFVASLPKTPTGKLIRSEAKNIVIKSS